jgi:phosphoserine/homoserine phosphotransferase
LSVILHAGDKRREFADAPWREDLEIPPLIISTAARNPEKLGGVKQSIVVLDLEGVLVPEIWISVAEKTRIPELRRTTRDEPDYDKLMRGRIKILDQHGLKLADIQEVIATLRPLPGALEFLRALRALTLEWPTIFCNRLEVRDGRIAGYTLRQEHPKRGAVVGLKTLQYFIIAAGDSFNDTAMLMEAHVGFLFHAPEHIKKQFPQFPAFEEYGDLLAAMKKALIS